VSAAPEAPGPVVIPESVAGDPATFDPDVATYNETIHFTGSQAVLDYNIRAAKKAVVPGSLMWAERLPDGSAVIRIVAKNGLDDTGAEWYAVRHEFYQCRSFGGGLTEGSLDFIPFAAIKLPRDFMYRTGSSPARR
jgi:hypothetical protein